MTIFSLIATLGVVTSIVHLDADARRVVHVDQPTASRIFEDAPGSEIRDLQCVNVQGDIKIIVLTDTNVMALQEDGVVLARAPIDRYDTDSPRMTRRLLNGATTAILTGGGLGTTRHVHAYDIQGSRLWRIQPTWSNSDNWAGSISHVHPIVLENDDWGFAVLARGNDEVQLFTSDGTLIDKVDAGESTDPDLAVVESKLWSDEHPSLIYGTRSNEVVCIGPGGQLRFRATAPPGVTWIGVVRVASNGGTLSGSGDARFGVTCTVHGELQNFELVVSRSGETSWKQGEAIRENRPIDAIAEPFSNHQPKSGWISAAVHSTQASFAGLSGRQLLVRVWSTGGTDVIALFDLVPSGGAGRADQVVGQPSIAVPQNQIVDTDVGFVAWGTTMWRIDVPRTEPIENANPINDPGGEG